MNKSLLILIAVILITSLISTAQNSRFGAYYDQRVSLFEKLPDTPGEIIFLGNSITDGCEWAELFNDPRVKNRGISGDVTAGVLNRLTEVTRSQPTAIFLLIGTNDLARNVPFDTIFSNICQIVKKIQQQSPATRLYVQSILPVNDAFTNFKTHVDKTASIKKLNTLVKDFCAANSCYYIDLFKTIVIEGTDKLDPRFTNDGLHLTGDGYSKWADVIRTFVKNL